MANASTVADKSSSGLVRKGLIEAFFAALISFGMFVLYIGLKTDQNINNQLIIVQRWGLLAIFVAIAAVGRFVVIVFLRPHLDQRKLSKARAGELEISTQKNFFRKHFLKIALVLMLLYPFIVISLVGAQGSLKYVDNFGIQILIYVMLAWGLNIVVGLAGLLDLGYVAFYAVGAYSYALLSTHFGLSFWILLPLSGIFAGLWGVILGFPVLRLRGDYLAIVTLAFGEIIRLVLINWTDVTMGTFGISSIPKATLFGIKFDASSTGFAKIFGLPMSSAYYKIFLFYLILALCMLTAYVTIRLRRMPIGRAWEALREDEIACRSLGINTVTTKLTAFATGAMFGGFAGSFFAARQGFVSPESFVFLESAVILAIVVLGGMGSLTGIAIAAVVMVGGTEILRDLDFLKVIFGPEFTPELYRMLLFGLAMVVVMLFKPRGFVGGGGPAAVLRGSRAVSGSFTKEGHG
jgi:branched-chain amino acid transport system permease protein